jgi:hypothetical protein
VSRLERIAEDPKLNATVDARANRTLASPALRAARRAVNVRTKPSINRFTELLIGLSSILQGTFSDFTSRVQSKAFDELIGAKVTSESLRKVSALVDVSVLREIARSTPIETLDEFANLLQTIAQSEDHAARRFASVASKYSKELDIESEIALTLIVGSFLQHFSQLLHDHR